jgi:hypothetical protein
VVSGIEAEPLKLVVELSIVTGDADMLEDGEPGIFRNDDELDAVPLARFEVVPTFELVEDAAMSEVEPVDEVTVTPLKVPALMELIVELEDTVLRLVET